jgi:hypothetical protein
VISHACDVAGLLLVDLLIHASCQRVRELGLRHHPPAGDPGSSPRHPREHCLGHENFARNYAAFSHWLLTGR